MDLRTKQIIIRKLAKDYRHASKGAKALIIDELIRLAGYNRSYARYVLRNPQEKKKQKRSRSSKYQVVQLALKRLWTVSNFSCGKILVAAIPALLSAMERDGELMVTSDEKRLLGAISASTCDRLLKPERQRLQLKGRSGTKPGSLLREQIPVRIFTPWDEQKVGFVEIDLVANCGESLRGDYVNTLDAVDIASGWSEKQAFMGKSEHFTLKAFGQAEKRFPFPLLGIDSDNGSEFINNHFLRMTQRRNITFTRSRPYKKNDQAHIEQKNWSTVRKIVGYQRFETKRQLRTLNQIYVLLSDYLNFFIPTFKLVRKEHIGSKVKRVYNKPTTPYLRLLEHPDVGEKVKKYLRQKYITLNPADLIRQINKLVNQLISE